MLRSLVFLFVVQQSLAISDFGPFCTEIDDICYTLSNFTLDHKAADEFCFFSFGNLAIVENESTWKKIMNQMLNKVQSDIWLGITVSSYERKFDQPVDLSSNSFWKSNGFYTSSDRRCMYFDKNLKTYNLDSCSKRLMFLCQFNGCNTKDLNIPNADFEYCNISAFLRPNMLINVNCWENFYLNGPKTITCLNGTFKQPTCNPACLSPPRKRDHAVQANPPKSFYKINEEVMFLCKKGFYVWDKFNLISHFKVQCQNDGIWSKEGKDCFHTSTIKFRLHSDLTLNCSTKDFESINWIKNGQVLTNSSKYEMTVTGGLKITDLYISDKGTYFCVAKKHKNVDVQNSFTLDLEEECELQTKETLEVTHEVLEDNFLILNCNLRSGEFRWLADGTENIESDEENLILPGGALLIKNIKLLDNKIYTCHCGNFTSAKHVLNVDPSVKTICGTNPKSSVVTFWYADDLTPFCYGTLIHTQWVITSAFCVNSFRHMKNPNISVHFTISDKNKKKSIRISRIKIHPLFRSRLNANDIALAKLEEHVRFNPFLCPLCLDKINFQPKYKCQQISVLNASVFSLGPLDTFKNQNKFPSEEYMILDYSDECRKTASILATRDLFCGESEDPSYLGDSGAPIVYYWKGKAHLIGIYSWGQRAIGLGPYDYFIDILYHYRWINSIID